MNPSILFVNVLVKRSTSHRSQPRGDVGIRIEQISPITQAHTPAQSQAYLDTASKSLRAIFVSVRKRHFLVGYKAQNPSRGWWPRLVSQRLRSLKQAFSSPYKDRAQALNSYGHFYYAQPQTTQLPHPKNRCPVASRA
jgi:hypothetical protein